MLYNVVLFVSFLYQILTVTHQRARRDTIFLPKCRQEIRIGKKSARCTYFLRGHISLLQHPFCQRQAVTEQIFGKGYSHTGMKYGRKIRFRQSCLLRRIRQPDFFRYFTIISYIFRYFKFSIVFFSNSSYDRTMQRRRSSATEESIQSNLF